MSNDDIIEHALTHGLSLAVTTKPDGTRIIKVGAASTANKQEPMTQAERARAYRLRQASRNGVTETQENVTKIVTPEPETVTNVTQNVTSDETTPSSPAPSPFPAPLPFSPLHPPLTLSPPQTPSSPPPTPEFLDLRMEPSTEPKKAETDPVKLRLFNFFNRRITRRLDAKEQAAFRKARIEIEDLDTVEQWWMDQHREWEGENYRPRTMITLLNGWSAAVDKADDWKAFPPPPPKTAPIFTKGI